MLDTREQVMRAMIETQDLLTDAQSKGNLNPPVAAMMVYQATLAALAVDAIAGIREALERQVQIHDEDLAMRREGFTQLIEAMGQVIERIAGGGPSAGSETVGPLVEEISRIVQEHESLLQSHARALEKLIRGD